MGWGAAVGHALQWVDGGGEAASPSPCPLLGPLLSDTLNAKVIKVILAFDLMFDVSFTLLQRPLKLPYLTCLLLKSHEDFRLRLLWLNVP